MKESVLRFCISVQDSKKKAHLHYLFFFMVLYVFQLHYTVVFPSAVLWHLCTAILPLNSCLIIPNLREYSNKADNAFFHMILQSWDSCSPAFGTVLEIKGTDFFAQLTGPSIKKKIREKLNKVMQRVGLHL